MIVATAGHIDHGKTRLIGAITGVDTDRLPEEKARGISIDLGFAYWTSPDGTLIGFVDVPGHERFVRNMVAGVCGIDFALLIVAADDGVMPQTLEHVQILDLLGVGRGLVAMTKVDRVEVGRRDEVRTEIAALLSGTTLEGSGIIGTSAVTGEGIEQIKERLSEAATDLATRPAADQHFRFAIDRAFSVEGSGTVVTGTVFSGATEPGARLCVSPDGTIVRVRALHVHENETRHVSVGQRCAINLIGVSATDVARGDWIVAEAIHRPTRRADVELLLFPGPSATLNASTRVHLHHGAGDVLARIVPLTGNTLQRGTRTVAQLLVDQPINALHGDRFILRDSAAHRTLGGGRILDPFVATKRRKSADRIESTAALNTSLPESALHALLERPSGVDLERFETMFNLVPDAAARLYRTLDVAVVSGRPRIGIPQSRHKALSEAVIEALSEFHRGNPSEQAMRTKMLRDIVARALALPVFEAMLNEISGSGRIMIKAGAVQLTDHDASANPVDDALWQRIRPMLVSNGIHVDRVSQLSQKIGVDEKRLRDHLHRRRASGTVYRIGSDRFCLPTTLATFAATAESLAQRTPEGTFTAAEFRDALRTNRTLAVAVLECLDGVGVTLRLGDVRKIRRSYVALLGEGTPLPIGGHASALVRSPTTKLRV